MVILGCVKKKKQKKSSMSIDVCGLACLESGAYLTGSVVDSLVFEYDHDAEWYCRMKWKFAGIVVCLSFSALHDSDYRTNPVGNRI